VQLNLFTLAHEKIGISRNYRFASSLRQQIDPAIEELTSLGFLAKAEYAGRGAATEIALYAGKGAVLSPASSSVPSTTADTAVINGTKNPAHGTNAFDVHNLIREKVDRQELAGHGSPREVEHPSAIGTELVERGIRQDQAAKLLATIPESAIPKIKQIIAHYDFLRATMSPKISRSPQGFLFHAVKNWDTFVLPAEKGKADQKQGALAFNSGRSVFKASNPQAMQSGAQERSSSSDSSRQKLELDYLVARRLEIKHIRETTIDSELLAKLTKDVESALARLRDTISAHRFREAVEHGVDEKIANLFAVPSFDEWLKDHPSRGVSGSKALKRASY
jgi:hypothetical protein